MRTSEIAIRSGRATHWARNGTMMMSVCERVCMRTCVTKCARLSAISTLVIQHSSSTLSCFYMLSISDNTWPTGEFKVVCTFRWQVTIFEMNTITIARLRRISCSIFDVFKQLLLILYVKETDASIPLCIVLQNHGTPAFSSSEGGLQWYFTASDRSPRLMTLTPPERARLASSVVLVYCGKNIYCLNHSFAPKT